MAKIKVENSEITVIQEAGVDFISLTDMASVKESQARSADIIKNWLRTRYTLEFLGVWEQIHNPNFKVVEFDHFKSQAGLPSFVISVSEWVNKTNAIGLKVRKGKYGGTFAHTDIAFEFGTAVSVKFKLYLILEYQRLKQDEKRQFSWSVKRELAKVNYHIHTQAIKDHLIPQLLSKEQVNTIYANEADVLNIALFGITAGEWRRKNPHLEGNMRDHASMNELICLSNLENINSMLIQDKISQSSRVEKLNQLAITQMTILQNLKSSKLFNRTE
jgi:hypothetical protein